MGEREPLPVAEDRVGWAGEFASPELERDYRHRHAPHDLALARVIIAVAAIATLALGALDYQLVPAGPTLVALGIARVGFFVASALALYLLRGEPSTVAFGRVLGAWYALTVLLHVLVGTAWPAGHAELRMTAALAVLMSYCIMPLPLRLQTVGALLHTLGSLLVVTWLNPTGEAASALSECCWLFVINVLGVYLAYRLHVRQRLLFAAALRQAELSASLGQALAEVRTLRGLIRVCAWCRKVDAGGDWQQLEVYVRDHSHAEFTHGICPICLTAATAEAKAHQAVARPTAAEPQRTIPVPHRGG